MVILADYIKRVFIEILIICLQVKNTPATKKLFVLVKKNRCSQTFPFLVRLGIWKCDPYLRDLSGTEKFVDMIHLCPDKGNILHLLLLYCLGATPQSGSFKVNTDEILFPDTFQPALQCILLSRNPVQEQ